MTITQMHAELDLELDRVASGDAPDLNVREKDDYLNKAIWIFLKEHFDLDKGKVGQGFETKSINTHALRNLHIKFPLQPALTPVNLGSGVWELKLNTLIHELFVVTRIQANIEKNGCVKKVISTFSQHDDEESYYTRSNFKWGRLIHYYGKARTTPTGTTSNVEKGAIYFDTNTAGAFTINSVRVEYLKYPNRVFFSGYNHIDGASSSSDPQIHCDIDSAYHHEIVSIAAREAYSDLGDTTQFQIKSARTIQDQ